MLCIALLTVPKDVESVLALSAIDPLWTRWGALSILSHCVFDHGPIIEATGTIEAACATFCSCGLYCVRLFSVLYDPESLDACSQRRQSK